MGVCSVGVGAKMGDWYEEWKRREEGGSRRRRGERGEEKREKERRERRREESEQRSKEEKRSEGVRSGKREGCVCDLVIIIMLNMISSGLGLNSRPALSNTK